MKIRKQNLIKCNLISKYQKLVLSLTNCSFYSILKVQTKRKFIIQRLLEFSLNNKNKKNYFLLFKFIFFSFHLLIGFFTVMNVRKLRAQIITIGMITVQYY